MNQTIKLFPIIFIIAICLLASCNKEEVVTPSPQVEFLLEWGSGGERDGEFNQPIGIAIDDEGFVYVSDSKNNRIQKFSEFGELYSLWSDGGTEDTALKTPMHITTDGKNVYVTEYETDRVQKFSPENKSISTFGKSDEKGSLDAPSGAAVDQNGNVYIASFYSRTVKKYSPTGEFLLQIGSPGKEEDGALNYPTDVAIGADGNVYVADAYNNRVQVFNPEGEFIRKWGDTPKLGDKAAQGSFNVAAGIDTDKNGRVYVADFYNHRIQTFDDGGNFIMSFGTQGTGEIEFERPTDIAVDNKGNVYVVDWGNDRVQKIKINPQEIK